MELRKADMPPIMTPAPACHTVARHHLAVRGAFVLLLATLLLATAGCDIPWPWGDRAKNSTILLSGTVDAHEVDLSFQRERARQKLSSPKANGAFISGDATASCARRPRPQVASKLVAEHE
jgi:hypothetical protein